MTLARDHLERAESLLDAVTAFALGDTPAVEGSRLIRGLGVELTLRLAEIHAQLGLAHRTSRGL